MGIYNVAIIGGGIIGVSISRLLSKYYLKVCVIEKEEEVSFGTSKANSGIIHAGFHDSQDTVKGKLCARGNELYDEWQRELFFPMKRVGELMVIQSKEDFPILEKYSKLGIQNGVPDLRIIEGSKLLKMEPNLNPNSIAALYAPTAGVVNPYELTFALAENAQKNGVDFFCGHRVLEINGNTIITTKRKIDADFIINAAGLYADEIAKMVGIDHKITPRKGEEYLLDKKLKGIVKRIIFPCPKPDSKGILVIPTLDGTIMVGPTAKMQNDKEDLSTSDEGFNEVFSKAKGLVPSINPRFLISAFAGARPVSETGDFIIGKTTVPNFINVLGIQSPGLTSAPSISLMVSDILRSEGLTLKPKGTFFKAHKKRKRLREMRPIELAWAIRKDKQWGRVVCRCETVSQREIVDAIKMGARTLDGIKFRTRAGMGRCQGGFCTYHISDILSKELKISPLEITKRGDGSEFVRGKTK